MQAVILAAGDGGRLYPLTAATPKPLLELRGRPIINHVLDALHAAGVDDVTIVVGHEAAQLRAAVDSVHPAGMTIRFVENDGYMLGNARSLWAARDAIDPTAPFVLCMADHLVDSDLVRTLTDGADGRCRLAVDTASAHDARADEATRALVAGGRVLDLGKEITHWNALDTGVFWCTPRIFDVLTADMRDGEAGAVFAALARAGELDAVDVTGCNWIDIDTREDLLRAASFVRSMIDHARPA
jgi:NDP-sugar pyrophosphorylase family protein